jgi:response regulator RpfG family c-di-GMP phosphodiesterase
VFKEHLASFCEVAEMLTDRLGVHRSVGALFGHVAERWDGKGQPGRANQDQIPLRVRIVHVACDAGFQRMLAKTSSPLV